MSEGYIVIMVFGSLALIIAGVALVTERVESGAWPGRCPRHHRKLRTLRSTLITRPGTSYEAAALPEQTQRMRDANECGRCGAAYDVTRAETATEYAERTKLGEGDGN